jgi:hypothetical protein
VNETTGELPRLLYAQDIAALLGWGAGRSAVQRARRWMKRNGMVDRDGRRYVTTRARLREAFPAAYLDAIEDLAR